MKRDFVSAEAINRRPAFLSVWNFVSVLVATLGALLLFATAAPAQTAAQNTPPVTKAGLVHPNDMGFGGLLLESTTPGYYVPAPLVNSDVDIQITGPLARTKITQKFENPSEGWVEGKYVFPLPNEAAVDSLRMQIGDRFIEGQIKEKQEAKFIYEQAKAQGFKASLVEQERPNIFTNSVANIGPGETVIVQIEYQEHVRLDNGQFSLRFPMVVGPRYNPKPTIQMVDFDGNGWGANVSDPVPDRDKITPPYLEPDENPEAPIINPVTLSVTLKAGFPINKVASSYHEVFTRRNSTEEAILTLKDGEVAANKDFELTWSPKVGSEPHAALFKETKDGEDYVLALVVPPKAKASADTIRPRETIFVLDNSGSMGGESIRQAKAGLLMALDQLKPGDRFNVIRFDDTFELVFPQPVEASAVNVARAKGFVGALDADGGTEMLPALNAALIDPTPNDTEYVRQVIFLTDGAIGNEDQLFASIRQGLGRSRLFTVGIGSAPNSHFMNRAARMGRGTFTHIGDLSQVAERMTELFDKLENPVMTDLIADWPSNTIGEVWPNPLPDLYTGEPVVLTAKMSEAKGALRIAGNLSGESWLADLDLSNAVEGNGVSKLWARKKISSIEESRFDGANWQAIDKGVLAVALEHHLVSRLTSLVAVDVTPSRPANEQVVTREVPLNLPEGWDFEKVFGGDTDNDIQIRKASYTNNVQFAALQVSDTDPTKVKVGPKGVPLPQGATMADLQILFGSLLALLSLAYLVWQRRGAPSPIRGRD